MIFLYEPDLNSELTVDELVAAAAAAAAASRGLKDLLLFPFMLFGVTAAEDMIFTNQSSHLKNTKMHLK